MLTATVDVSALDLAATRTMSGSTIAFAGDGGMSAGSGGAFTLDANGLQVLSGDVTVANLAHLRCLGPAQQTGFEVRCEITQHVYMDAPIIGAWLYANSAISQQQITHTPTGTTLSIFPADSLRQTVDLRSIPTSQFQLTLNATGVRWRSPSHAGGAVRVICRDSQQPQIVWTINGLTQPVHWLGDEPEWTDLSGQTLIVVWDYDGANLLLAATGTTANFI